MKPYTLKQFIEYVHTIDCLNTTAPPHTVTKKKYSLTKRKVVRKKISEVRTNNGIPFEVTTQSLITKPVTDTNGITKLIVDYLRYVYGSKSVRRISSEGKWRQGIGYIRSENKGLSDIEGFCNGHFISIELKVGKDKQRESQIKRQKEVESDGGIYYLCKWESFEKFQQELNDLFNE